jgi:hypothetical protein
MKFTLSIVLNLIVRYCLHLHLIFDLKIWSQCSSMHWIGREEINNGRIDALIIMADLFFIAPGFSGLQLNWSRVILSWFCLLWKALLEEIIWAPGQDSYNLILIGRPTQIKVIKHFSKHVSLIVPSATFRCILLTHCLLVVYYGLSKILDWN